MKIDLNKISHIFIDFDGTLVNTVPMLYQNYLSFLRHFSYFGTKEEFSELMGPSIKEFVPILKKKYHLKPSNQELYKLYLKNLPQSYKFVEYMPGALEFLKYAKENHFCLSLVTSTPKELLDYAIEPLKLNHYFSLIITADNVKKTKPSPEIYLLALKNNHIKSDQAITIEDSFNGIVASKNAHIQTIALQEKTFFQDVLHFKSWEQILDLFKGSK